jgi:TatD DNase family protein
MAGLEAAYGAGGALIVDPGVDFDDFLPRRERFGACPFVRLAAGIWPDAESMKDVERRVAVLDTAVSDPSCVAVGECGLDYHWMNGTEVEQAALFGAQVELAVHNRKPLIVHSRLAFAPTLSLVRTAAVKIPVVIHCFGYGEDEARAFLAAGCYLSFAGNITYRKSAGLRAACAIVPDDRLLLETDAPYMNPEPGRGKPSSPLDIGRTYAAVSEIRGSGPGHLAALVTANTRALFG